MSINVIKSIASINSNLKAILAIIGFVFCWGSGYIAARYTVGHFEPINLLFIRYVGTVFFLVFLVLCIYRRESIHVLKEENIFVQSILGILYHVIYIGCVFYAVKLGLSASVTSLVLATQPLATLLLITVISRQWPRWNVIIGTILCLFGAILIIEKIGAGDDQTNKMALVIALFGVAAICIATVIHARSISNSKLWPSLLIQFFFGFIGVSILLFFGLEPLNISFTKESLLFILFVIFITTLGSYTLMAWLVKNIPTTIYSNIFYLVPLSVMLIEYSMYDEVITLIQLTGSLIILMGIYLGFNYWHKKPINKKSI